MSSMQKMNIDLNDCYNMNVTLADVIAQHLRAFIECNVSSPVEMDSDEWTEMLEKMAAAFETYATRNGSMDEAEEASVKEGMRLFIEHFDDLWY